MAVVFSLGSPPVTPMFFVLAKRWWTEQPHEYAIEGETIMNWKSKLVLGILTAVAMYLLTFLLPRGGMLRDTALVQFPLTVGVWAIFVLLFVKLK